MKRQTNLVRLDAQGFLHPNRDLERLDRVVIQLPERASESGPGKRRLVSQGVLPLSVPDTFRPAYYVAREFLEKLPNRPRGFLRRDRTPR